MHIDSKWKFKEMIQFRDEYAKKYGWNLIVESNMEAFKAGVGPFTHGSKVHTDLMKTQATCFMLSTNINLTLPSVGHAATKRNHVPRNVSSLSATNSTSGTPKTSVGTLGHLQCPHPQRRKHPCVPAEQLDRTGHLAVYPS